MEFDSANVVVKVVLFLVATKFLKKYYESEIKDPLLISILNKAWIGAIILGIIIYSIAVKYSDKVFYYWLYAFILFCTWRLNEPKITKTVFIATLPLFITSTIVNLTKDLIPSLFESISVQLLTIDGFANTWLIGFTVYSFWQTRKDRQQRLKDIEERNLLMAQKNTLEYQVAERTAEITKQKEELEKAFEELKSTQGQLVHAEKMASLGELTAGIAHEIQNPLNFVNNFSEVSTELCEELNQHIENEQIDKKFIKELLFDLSQNQQKITHHGQRASSIVKGMLQHSRTSTGEKEMTDINALADEYLRLSYHGLRAKDKTFNADFKINIDPNIPKISIIPQDIGRVLLNLINNAFYAAGQSTTLPKEVIVTTKKLENRIEIRVKDSGNGISKEVQSKIFQPFFTTKPTGEGTGLGLSMAYDIVTNGHGGTLEVVSEDGKGAEFIVKLPIV